MKKIVFIIIICALSACDPDEHLYENVGSWYIKNNTSGIIKVALTEKRFSELEHSQYIISSGDSAEIWGIGKLLASKEVPVFNDIIETNELHINLYSENDILISNWDNVTESGRQSDFFKEDSWRFTYKERYSSYIWTYDINPEDIR